MSPPFAAEDVVLSNTTMAIVRNLFNSRAIDNFAEVLNNSGVHIISAGRFVPNDDRIASFVPISAKGIGVYGNFSIRKWRG